MQGLRGYLFLLFVQNGHTSDLGTALLMSAAAAFRDDAGAVPFAIGGNLIDASGTSDGNQSPGPCSSDYGQPNLCFRWGQSAWCVHVAPHLGEPIA